MNFRNFIEMASFTLPKLIKIDDKRYAAIDMMFEKKPTTYNKDGKVMNQGSKFVAKIPDSGEYLVYDGEGEAFFASSSKAKKLINQKEYEEIPDTWWKKARFIDEF